jgi:hypothetical protein
MSSKAPQQTRAGKIVFKLHNFREWPDPNFGGAREMRGDLRVMDMPLGCNLAPNVRVQYTKSRVFRELKQAMLNEDKQGKDALHLGCLGITFITTKAGVKRNGDLTELMVNNRGMFCGVVNGGHVNLAALQARAEMEQLLNDGKSIKGDRQHIPIHIFVGTPKSLRTYIARAQNRTVQVPDEALMNSEGVFDKIKDQLRQDGTLQFFGQKGNETLVDESKVYKIGYNLRLLECFLPHKYRDGSRAHPNRVVTGPGRLVTEFKKPTNQIRYDSVLHLLRDFWTMYELISVETYSLSSTRIKPDSISIMKELKKSTPRWFPFIYFFNDTATTEIYTFAFLAAFRQYLVFNDEEELYEWDRPFAQVLEEMRSLLKPMFKDARSYVGSKKASSETKHVNYWRDMFNLVKMHRLQQQVGSGGNSKPSAKRKKRKTSAKRKTAQRRLNLPS